MIEWSKCVNVLIQIFIHLLLCCIQATIVKEVIVQNLDFGPAILHFLPITFRVEHRVQELCFTVAIREVPHLIKKLPQKLLEVVTTIFNDLQRDIL